jgi:hypothetical protein
MLVRNTDHCSEEEIDPLGKGCGRATLCENTKISVEVLGHSFFVHGRPCERQKLLCGRPEQSGARWKTKLCEGANCQEHSVRYLDSLCDGRTLCENTKTTLRILTLCERRLRNPSAIGSRR